MEIETAIRLIKDGVFNSHDPQTWADLGAGSGLFTQALADRLPTGSTIYALDKEEKAMKSLKLSSDKIKLKKMIVDFEKSLDLNNLDGILMANALHYVKDKKTFLFRIKGYLKNRGRMIMIEYDTSHANPWVPFPIPYPEMQSKITEAGFTEISKIGEEPSRFRQGNIYASLVIV